MSSSSLSLLLLLLLSVARRGEPNCDGTFRPGEDNFVLDAQEAVREGAALRDTTNVSADADCKTLCCQDSRCNLALLEPLDAQAGTRTCVRFDCVYKNRFVCRFVNQAGYQSYIRTSVFQRYLQGPGKQAAPIANAGRDVVVQPGEIVTLNGSESLAMHETHITAYSWKLQQGNPDVTMEKTDLPDQVRLSNLSPGPYVFQLTVTDSKRHSNSDEVRVLVLSPETSGSYCMAPVKVGPCRAAFPRWHYNVTKGTCEQFTFGGCKPNKNNFLSEYECMAACRGVTVSSERSITLPAAEVCGSPCRQDQLTCDNKCCLDRSLECDGVTQCSDGSDEISCSTLSRTFSQLLSINVSQSKVRCTEPPFTGPCRASHSRWYYDPLERKCDRFTYGGCDANGNNFEEEAVCSATCEGVTDKNVFSRGIFARFETDKEDETNSGSVALAVVLSLTILVILAILGYCFLQRRKERSRRAAVPSRELQEQDTLVYNSTTKPL